MKTSVKLLLAFATAAAAIAPAAAQQVVAWDEAYRQADARIAQLTLDEKISFMRGYSSFFFYGVPEKGMPYIYLSDATQGVHMRDNLSDPTMVRQLERSTAFPCPISLAATFNPSLAYRYAEAVGEECRAGGIEVLLGPGMNIYRNSQNGRNFEYMGEDPLLASAMVAEYVKGMQSTGTVACLKHFICNETEFYRRRPRSPRRPAGGQSHPPPGRRKPSARTLHLAGGAGRSDRGPAENGPCRGDCRAPDRTGREPRSPAKGRRRLCPPHPAGCRPQDQNGPAHCAGSSSGLCRTDCRCPRSYGCGAGTADHRSPADRTGQPRRGPADGRRPDGPAHCPAHRHGAG